MKKMIVLLLMCSLFILAGKGQTSEYSYAGALELYNQGHYDEALKYIEEYKKYNKYNADGENIFILATQIYIEKGDFQKSNESLTELFRHNPNYVPPLNNYQEDFYTYVRNIVVRPKITVGVRAARTFPVFTNKKTYSVYDSTDYASPYKKQNGYCYSFYLQQNFNANFAVLLDYSYSKFGYKRTLTRNGVDNFELKYSEIIYNNELGLSIKKYLFKDHSKLLLNSSGSVIRKGSGPYICLGGYYSKMRQAQANAEVNYIFTNRYFQSTEPKNLTRNNIDVIDMRNTKRFGLNAALGSSLTIDRFVISLEAKYLYDLTSLTNPEKRYNNTELLYNYYYIDNDVSMSRIDVSLSLAYILNYKVKSKIK